jgi:thiamine-phosphate pyrophosphorylase
MAAFAATQATHRGRLTGLLVSAAFRTELSDRNRSTHRVSETVSLYLDFQIDGGSAAEAASMLSAAIHAAPISSVLLRISPGSDFDRAALPALIALTRKNGIAALIEAAQGDTPLLGADGVHVPWSPDLVRTFKTLRQTMPGIIIGADAGRSRHEAMELGEAGADYVAFGIPPHVGDREKAAERQLGLIAWWAELFELPCVAFDVPDAEAAHALAAAGADFIGSRVTSRSSENDAVAHVRAISEAIRIFEPAK